MHRPASCRESAFYLCYCIFVGGGVLDAPRGKLNQNVGGNVPQALFVAEILRLRHAKIFCKFLLGQVVVLAHVPQTGIVSHSIAPR